MADPTIIASFGAIDSNSYATYEYANSYMDTKVNKSPWDNATVQQRKASLLEATRIIDARNWRGERYYFNQRLEFPRTLYSDRYGDSDFYALSPIGSPANPDWTKMKERVRDACCEQALFVLDQSGDDTLMKLQKRGVRSFSESIKGISESYTFTGAVSGLSSEAVQLLSWYYESPRLHRG